ncbi:MAG TPA: sulfotransferase family protein [Gammaproteobacteria bacterium]|nr:sulfotransferase family protein [Gammaproteobacteria bacterium]
MAKSNILIKSKLKKANALVNEGKLTEARTLYLQLYKTNRTNPEVGLSLAVIHRKTGDFEEAELISRQVLANVPDNAYAHHIYGSALQCLGQMEQAISEYKKAIKLDPLLIEAHYFLGNIYQLTDERELAAESYKVAVKLNPNFFEALNNLGAVLIELHQPIEAKQILDRALKIDPDSNQLLCNITDFYLLAGENPEQAFYYANKAYNADPNFVDALKSMGKYYYQKPDYDQALEFYRKAYDISPDNSTTGLIAQILERRGEFDEANELITPLIKSGNTDFQTLMTFSALSRKFNNQRMAIGAIEEKIKTTKFDKPSLLNLHSELGKQYDALKEYDNAFNNYQIANQLDREFNEEVVALNEIRDMNNTNREDIDGWFENYPADFWRKLPCSNNDSKRPIFVIGMFRSGTTLCEQIFSSHPDVAGAGELRDINQLSYKVGKSKLHDRSPASLENISQKALIDSANSYLQTLDECSADTKHVVDKMPSNFYHVGLISRMFPNAHIVHMIRDPRDVCLSMYFQRFSSQMTFSTDLTELADYHLAYQRIMQYWHQALDIKILDVVYEELMEDQEAMTRKMLDFCDLDWNDSCLNFHQNKRDVNTPSYDQVRKPLYKKSVARWKNYEKHLGPLIDRLYPG